MSTINYAIELNLDDDTIDNPEFGIVRGVLRAVTGTPGYNGNGPYPIYDNTGTTNTDVWYEGIILRDGLSAPSTSIDIIEGGNYATLSGFNFNLNNTMDLGQWLTKLNILQYKKVKFYVIIDDVFYYRWSGIVDTFNYTDTTFLINCVSDFKKLHKSIPTSNNSNLPGAYTIENNSYIPVSIGNLKTASGTTAISSGGTYENNGLYDTGYTIVDSPGGTQYKTFLPIVGVTNAGEYTIGLASSSITSRNSEYDITTDWFVGAKINVVGYEDIKGVVLRTEKIEGNPKLLKIFIDRDLPNAEIDAYLNIYQDASIQLISTKPIYQYLTNRPLGSNSDNRAKDLNGFKLVSDDVSQDNIYLSPLNTEYDKYSIDNTGFPGFKTSYISDPNSNNIEYNEYVSPDRLGLKYSYQYLDTAFLPGTGYLQNLSEVKQQILDSDSTVLNYDDVSVDIGEPVSVVGNTLRSTEKTSGVTTSRYFNNIQWEYPIDTIYKMKGKLGNLIPNFVSTLKLQGGFPDNITLPYFDVTVDLSVVPIGYDRPLETKAKSVNLVTNRRVTVQDTETPTYYHMYFTEDFMHPIQDDTNIVDNLYYYDKEFDLIDDLIITNTETAIKSVLVQLDVSVLMTQGLQGAFNIPYGITQYIHKVGSSTFRNVEFSSLACSIRGETTENNSEMLSRYGYDFVQTPPSVIEYIMRVYDGMTDDDIEYNSFKELHDSLFVVGPRPYRNNVALYSYYLARQWKESEKTIKSIIDICTLFFLCIVPDINGKRKIVSWLDKSEEQAVATHDADIIIRDSLSSIQSSTISRISNVLNTEYDYNNSTGKYTKSVTFDKFNEDEFPEPLEKETNFTYQIEYAQWGYNVINSRIDGFPDSSLRIRIFNPNNTFGRIQIGDSVTLGEELYTDVNGKTAKFIVNNCPITSISYYEQYIYIWIDIPNIHWDGGLIRDSITIFSGITATFGTGKNKWETCTQGIGKLDYNLAKRVWDRCKKSVDIYGTLQETSGVFKNNQYINTSSEETDYKLYSYDSPDKLPRNLHNTLDLMSQWLPYTKDKISYSVSMIDGIYLNLMDTIIFNDELTENENRLGWITKLKYNTKKNTIDITLTFEVSPSIFNSERRTIDESTYNTEHYIDDVYDNINIIDEN